MLSKTGFHFLGSQASPGNLTQFEEILFGGGTGSEASAGVVAVRYATGTDGQRVVGVGYADAAQRTMGVCEFADNEIFSNLESLLVQISPKECLLAQGEGNADGSKLREVGGGQSHGWIDKTLNGLIRAAISVLAAYTEVFVCKVCDYPRGATTACRMQRPHAHPPHVLE